MFSELETGTATENQMTGAVRFEASPTHADLPDKFGVSAIFKQANTHTLAFLGPTSGCTIAVEHLKSPRGRLG
jgi:hypothetical protein